ncbi:unnamed protein product [Anisakis simplex]|uniref:Uncharacterized protein n=1 Tax=Anisakis simplex TaxID=6269 RepID=A0A0M3K6Y8_ANISI|nr:unnamed protein product [Anisakis simplex]
MDEQSFDLASDNDSEYEDYQTEATTQQLPPLVTFATSGLHSDKKLAQVIPPRRRTHFEQNVAASANKQQRNESPLKSLNHSATVTADSVLPARGIVANIVPIAQAKPIVSNGHNANGQPRISGFPIGGMDFKLNTQDLAIVSNNHVKEQLEKVIKSQSDLNKPKEKSAKSGSEEPVANLMKSSKKITEVKSTKSSKQTSTTTTPFVAKKIALITTKTPALVNVLDPFQRNPIREMTQSGDDFSESDETTNELEPAVRLEQKIANTVQLDRLTLESQILNVRDLEIVRDPLKKDKWCKK